MKTQFMELRDSLKKEATHSDLKPHFYIQLYGSPKIFYKKRKAFDYLTQAYRDVESLKIEIGFNDLLIQSFLNNVEVIGANSKINGLKNDLYKLKEMRDNRVFGINPYIHKCFLILKAQKDLCIAIHDYYKERSEKSIYQSTYLLSQKIEMSVRLYESRL